MMTEQDDQSRKQERQQERQQEADDLRQVMSSKAGRRMIYRLLERGGVWRSSFRPDPLEMAFREGARNLALQLMADLTEHCRDEFNEMNEENGK